MIKNIVFLLFFCLICGCYVESKPQKRKPKRYLNIEVIPYNYNFYYYQRSYHYTIPLRNHKKHNQKNNIGHHGPRR